MNESWSFRAASRVEQFSMADMKSSTLPPIRPPRAATQESEWQAQAFFWTLTMKLSRLFLEVCAGSGQRPRRCSLSKAMKSNAVIGQHHFHRNGRLHRLIIDPLARNDDHPFSGPVPAI